MNALLALGPLDRVIDLFESNRDLAYLYWQAPGSGWHLMLCLLLFGILFFTRLTLAARRVDAARGAVPLVIGGWGTRGKSGTERKKAALFAALGAEVVTKTTGCEAMFIHSQAGTKPLELFIYRPYGKATIWEQRDLIELARDLEAHVFLYECMALNPQYVRIIQDGWMRDDISTITNTYPDHEDIQGPAGIDLPYVMTNFIPQDSTCFTAEENMLPILEEGAADRNTTMVPVTWRDAALIPEDVLARYPYNVHPLNVALVTRMAEHLGIERDFVWKEVADHIIPDLGVLNVFGVAEHLCRRLEFSNGHSANERHGFNANWSRLGLGDYDAAEQPGTWLITVVNNRGDRVARSKVFADVLTQDANAHAHVLIGSNLTGLQGYMETALASRLENVSLFRGRDESVGVVEHAQSRLDAELADLMFEVPDKALVEAKLRAMLGGIGLSESELRALLGESLLEASARSPLRSAEIDPLIEAEQNPRDATLEVALADLERKLQGDGVAGEVAGALARFHLRNVCDHNTYAAFSQYLSDELSAQPIPPAQVQAADERFRALLTALYRRKILIVEDPLISGDGIVDFIARHMPPGFLIHIHGCQNIKGPGLDWVYRWIGFGQSQKACARLQDPRPESRMAALTTITANRDYGLLDAPIAIAAVERARAAQQNQDLGFQTHANLALAHLDQCYRQARDNVRAARATEASAFARFAQTALDRVSTALEKFLDAGDAKGRRRDADRVRRDLIDGRMGHDRAALELRTIVKRGKGGWLQKAIDKRVKALRESLGLPERKAMSTSGDRD